MLDKKIKVIHIAPGAFDYFDNIKNSVFNLIDRQRSVGLEVELTVLQYSPDSKKNQKIQEKKFPGIDPQGFFAIDEVIDNLDKFDIIHLHAPFLGVGKIWRWLKEHPKTKVCLTYYEPVEKSDLFSWFITAYNSFYLPRFFKRSNLVVMNDPQKFVESFGKKYFNSSVPLVDLSEATREVMKENNIHLTNNTYEVKLTMEESRILAYFNFYNFIMNSYE